MKFCFLIFYKIGQCKQALLKIHNHKAGQFFNFFETCGYVVSKVAYQTTEFCPVVNLFNLI